MGFGYLVFIMAAATLLAFWCGWGLARLLLPASLQPWRTLLAPLLGYAAVRVPGYWPVRALAGLPTSIRATVPAAAVINALAWRRSPPQRPPRPTWRTLAAHGPLLALLLATLLVGIAPLISYGYSGIIGGGWD